MSHLFGWLRFLLSVAFTRRQSRGSSELTAILFCAAIASAMVACVAVYMSSKHEPSAPGPVHLIATDGAR